MSNNILLAEIETELEKINNLIGSGELDDVRRSRIANHGEALEVLQKQIKNGTAEVDEINDRFLDLKKSLENL
jgi:hypothetical protein